MAVLPKRVPLDDRQRDQLDALLDLSSEEFQLQDREISFIDEMDKRRDHRFVESQLNRLDRIYRKVFGSDGSG